MKKFISRITLFVVIFLIISETLCHLVIDPLYFYSINTYNEKEGSSQFRYDNTDSKHVDFLFIGSSRIPATINPQLFKKLSSGVTINAGRGYITPGVHYQGLKSKLKEHPDYLRNSIVLIEYSGSGAYTSPFAKDMLSVFEPTDSDKTDKAMPHLLLPYLDMNSFLSFLKKSNNSILVKVEMTFLYFSSTYRASQYVNDKFFAYNKKLLFPSKATNLVSEGGIRNDDSELAGKKAILLAKEQKEKIQKEPLLSNIDIDNSSLAQLYKLIKDNGGTLMLYEMPLHSLQQDIYNSEKAKLNKATFEKWLSENNIPIIYNPDFKYKDIDFPDTWHLSSTRRDEFTTKLYYQIAEKIGRNQQH